MCTAGYARASQCYGTVANGRIEAAVELPKSGENFHAYSVLGHASGRMYVHARIANVVGATYRALEKSMPDKRFVLGETGWKKGGRFRPHRTHQNGLSVDFFVPLIDREKRSVPIPTHALNKWGYGVEFDRRGRMVADEGLRIDFEALAEHIYQLDVAANNEGIAIAKVIVDPPYLSLLFATKRGAHLKHHVPFMKTAAWVRHDDHIHVDFAVPCLPIRK